MRPEAFEAHSVPMRPWNDMFQEPYVEHRSEQECKHPITCEEVQDDKAFKKIRKFEPGERKRNDLNPVEVADEVRTSKLLGTIKNDWDNVSVGLPEHNKFTGMSVTPRDMPSQFNKTVRLAVHKWARAEFYNVRPQKTSGVVDQAELAKVMAELNLE